MDQNNLNDKQKNKNWDYLPNISTLSLYLNHNELVQLSKVCKKYRVQLKSIIFRKLIISDIRNILQNFDFTLEENFNIFDSMINELKIDFYENYNLVKEVKFTIGFSNKFAKDLFKLFSKITKLTIVKTRGEYSLKNLIMILHNSNHLRHIDLNCSFVNFKPKNIYLNYGFFYKLKSIRLEIPSEVINDALPFDVIDPSFCNLNSLTVINNRMLSNICNGLPSLGHAELSPEYTFDESLLTKFISNSHQLRKLSISTKHMGQAVMNQILQSKVIEHLTIKLYHSFINTESDKNIKNYSIKQLTIERSNHEFNPIKILELCHNIETLEFISFFDNLFWQTQWKAYTGSFNTIILNALHYSVLTSLIPNITNSKEIKFINSSKFSTFLDYFKLCKNEYWVPKQGYSLDTVEFTLVRRSA